MSRKRKIPPPFYTVIISFIVALLLPGCQNSFIAREMESPYRVKLENGIYVHYAGVQDIATDYAWYERILEASKTLLLNKKLVLIEEASENGEKVAFIYTPVWEGNKERYLFVNAEMVLFGLAQVIDPIPESAKHPALWQSLQEAQKEAKAVEIGIWSKPNSAEQKPGQNDKGKQ